MGIMKGCSFCGRQFGSFFAYEQHRVWRRPGARCLSDEELIEAGMKQRSSGVWVFGRKSKQKDGLQQV